jgi:2-polyprenyl-3-methyl-5-hydroxy-6-metoxy-1,4-benzoquinol methylase
MDLTLVAVCDAVTNVHYTRHVLDPSNGYEAAAARYMAARSRIGADVVRRWALSLPLEAAALDLGCGHGVPVTEALLAAGCNVHAIDASPSLVSAFRERFPDVPVACEAADLSTFLDSQYDGIVAWGLMFLLTPAAQGRVITNVSLALMPGGTFLFTAPSQSCTWTDVLTGQLSTSLGAPAYHDLLAGEGLVVREEGDDEGGNHYYVAKKPSA